eukprot:82424-Rhodomonas_salina.1
MVFGRPEQSVLDQHPIGVGGEGLPCPVHSMAVDSPEDASKGVVVPGCVPLSPRGGELDVPPLNSEGPWAPKRVWMPHPPALVSAVEEVTPGEAGNHGQMEGGAVPPVWSGSPPEGVPRSQIKGVSPTPLDSFDTWVLVEGQRPVGWNANANGDGQDCSSSWAAVSGDKNGADAPPPCSPPSSPF